MSQDSLPPMPEPSQTNEVVRRFTEVWAHPSVDRFVAVLDPEVRLLQPVTPPVIGRDAARREFERLLRWLPDVRGEVDDWSAAGDTIFIGWRMSFALGGRSFELRIVDRIVVRDGLIHEREAYFDSLRFFLATLVRPSAWLGYLRYRGYLPGGRG